MLEFLGQWFEATHMAVKTERRLMGSPPDARWIRKVADLDACDAQARSCWHLDTTCCDESSSKNDACRNLHGDHAFHIQRADTHSQRNFTRAGLLEGEQIIIKE